MIITSFKNRIWQRVIFPGSGPPSIFTAMSLYDRVRDGNGWFPHAWSPENLRRISVELNYSRNSKCNLHTESCTEL